MASTPKAATACASLRAIHCAADDAGVVGAETGKQSDDAMHRLLYLPVLAAAQTIADSHNQLALVLRVQSEEAAGG